MNNKITKIVLSIFMVVLVFSACDKNEPELPSSSENSSEISEETSLQESESSEEISKDEEEKKEAFIKHILLYFGAEELKADDEYNFLKKDLIQEAPSSFYYLDDFSSAAEIESINFYSWYIQTIWKEDLPQEELFKKYAFPDADELIGWFIPEEMYLERVKKYFDVTDDFLKNTDAYIEEKKGFWLDGGGGIGDRNFIYVESETKDNEFITYNLKLQSVFIETTGEGKDKKEEIIYGKEFFKELTIKNLGDGKFNYVSYKTVDK